MLREEDLIKIGVFNKTHGTQGELSLSLRMGVPEDERQLPYVICRMDGLPVPFFLESLRIKSDHTALVRLEGVDTREKAQQFGNADVLLEKDRAAELMQDDDTEWGLIGFDIVTPDGRTVGQIVEIDDSTANTLFVVEKGDEELLIPAHEEFVRAIDKKKQRICMELPEGLLSIHKP